MPNVDDHSALIVGLGNPGYDGTPHNMGFLFVDWITKLYSDKPICPSLSFSEKKMIDDIEVQFLKPKSYMNDSGLVVLEALKKKTNFKLGSSADFLLVVADNVELPPGAVKLRFNSGSAGHRGIKSIQQTLNSKLFFTLWIGVGRPNDLCALSDYVTVNMSEEHCKRCTEGMKEGLPTLLHWLQSRKEL